MNANNAGVSTAFLTLLHWMAEWWFNEVLDMKVLWYSGRAENNRNGNTTNFEVNLIQ